MALLINFTLVKLGKGRGPMRQLGARGQELGTSWEKVFHWFG